jgi:hypothetical protein
MVQTERVTALLQDAWALYADALEELERGKPRNAAEKAWRATKRATDALILARTGVEPATAARTTQGLHSLISQDRQVGVLEGSYHTRADYLHGQCFYDGICEPPEEVGRLIRETDSYIRDAQELMSNQ